MGKVRRICHAGVGGQFKQTQKTHMNSALGPRSIEPAHFPLLAHGDQDPRSLPRSTYKKSAYYRFPARGRRPGSTGLGSVPVCNLDSAPSFTAGTVHHTMLRSARKQTSCFLILHVCSNAMRGHCPVTDWKKHFISVVCTMALRSSQPESR